jgi:adenosylhomocysteine nucleosidase
LSGIGLVVALPREIPAGFVRLGHRESTRSPAVALYRFSPDTAQHVAVQTGVGRTRAAEGARLLIRDFSPHTLVSFGFAGGLSPELARGTLVIGTALVCDDSAGKVVAANRDLVDQIQSAADGAELPVQQGILVTTWQIVADPAAKSALRGRSGACAVDMETAGIVEVAHQVGLPWVAIRAIVDGAGDSLPEACLTTLHEDGHVAAGRLIRTICRSPQLLWHFWQLAGDMATARRHLSQVFERWTKALAAQRDQVPG